jgi:hypothetical protein
LDSRPLLGLPVVGCFVFLGALVARSTAIGGVGGII